MSRVIGQAQPDVVVHTQAMSDVDRCECQPELARAMNAGTTEHLVAALQGTPAILIHLSTDYVFDGEARRRIEAFADQTTSPTYTEDLAQASRGLVAVFRAGRFPASRIVHVTNAGAATRVEFAHTVADILGLPREGVTPIRMADQRRPAKRPAYSALASSELTPLLGPSAMRSWQDAVTAYLMTRRHP